MKYMGYDAVGLGRTEAYIDNGGYYIVAKALGLPIVAPESDSSNGSLPYIIKEINGIKVGIAAFNTLTDSDDTFQTKKKCYAAYAAARKKSDILIVLDQGNVIKEHWLRLLGKRLGAPDIVIGSEKNSGLKAPRIVGKTYSPPTSQKGATVGIIDVEFVFGETPKFQFSQKELTKEILDDESINTLIKEYEEKEQAASLITGAAEQASESKQQ